jgi:ABC-type branched-subunit amino acid transport system ATPase component
MSALEISGFQVRGRGVEVTLQDCRVEAGEWLSLSAPSGFGKTTLLRGMIGLEPASGSLRLGGREMIGLSVERRNFGVVFQDQLLFPHLDAWKNALFGVGLRRKPEAGDLDRAREGFELLGLSHRKHARIQELSGGERQRIALLRAILFDPDLLFLDEAFKGMDSDLITRCRELLDRTLSVRSIPVIWITHQNEFEPDRMIRLVGEETKHGHRHFKHDSRKP